MPCSTRINKEIQLLFSSDPASFTREDTPHQSTTTIVHALQYQNQQGNSTAILIRSCKFHKGRHSSSIDNNNCSSPDFRQPPSTQTPVSSTDTRSPLSTEATLPSTDIFHPTSIDTSVRTSIDTKPRDMVATLILVRDDNGDLHDQEGHMRNAAGQRIDAQGGFNP
ncbi:hypothetical protein F2Q68_00039204 [Brassica cretica]|uniref:Uncharacterized protein n=1 Tax=Brassica cretica TaxID=69181 RepID=A0A8S9ML41_BRACR|nr:hypothetical protein F2Q68_00039204 [Brassica cretica]